MINNELFNQADEAFDNGDLDKAFSLFKKGADSGDHHAMTRLGAMYSDGEGVEVNIDESILWDLKAISSGSTLSLFNLAITYRTLGDIKSAKAWLEKAIAAGDGEACLQLAKLYMVSDKEILTVKKYLLAAIDSTNICEESVEEASNILNNI